ncbi:hypothetical protein BSC11_24245, partial [Salmonella enterica]|nr:hypothetical protein [Salmonella enterica]
GRASRGVFLFAGNRQTQKISMRFLKAAGVYFHERRSPNNIHRDRVITFEQINIIGTSQVC